MNAGAMQGWQIFAKIATKYFETHDNKAVVDALLRMQASYTHKQQHQIARLMGLCCTQKAGPRNARSPALL